MPSLPQNAKVVGQKLPVRTSQVIFTEAECMGTALGSDGLLRCIHALIANQHSCVSPSEVRASELQRWICAEEGLRQAAPNETAVLGSLSEVHLLGRITTGGL